MCGEGKKDIDIVDKGKKFGIILAIISMFIAPFIMYAPQGLFQYLQAVNGFFNVPIFTIIFIGYVTKKVPAIAAKISLTFFVCSYGILQLVIKPEIHFLHQLGILFIISCVIMLIVGKIKPREEAYEIKDRKVVNIQPWEHRYEASGIVIFVMISMYIVFSKIGLAGKKGICDKTFIAIVLVGILMAIMTLVLKKRSQKIANKGSQKLSA